MAAFSDVHVNFGRGNSFPDHAILTAIKLGYRVIAVNKYVDAFGSHGLNLPDHTSLQPTKAFLDQIKKVASKDAEVRFLTRVTIVLPIERAAEVFHHLPESYKNYDLVAVQPSSSEGFELACKTLPVDIISIDAEKFVRYAKHLKRTTIKPALARNITFELLYGPMIGESGLRRDTLIAARTLLNTCPGVLHNTILSSAVDDYHLLRAPHDVANIAVLFGMSTHTCKEIVTSNCRNAIKHAEARRVCKTAMVINDLSKKDIEPSKRAGEQLDKKSVKKKKTAVGGSKS